MSCAAETGPAALRLRPPGGSKERLGVSPESSAGSLAHAIPDYLVRHYAWAYLSARNLPLLDRSLVVSAILWGNYGRLQRAVLAELAPEQSILQAACVYGQLSPALAGLVGARGRLDVVDVAPLQVDNCRRKLAEYRHAKVHLADAARPAGGPYDAICCFFLLHELPDDHKRRVVDGLLASLAADGKAIFVDYHKPHWAHPLKGPMRLVFAGLEPFAASLWRHEIADFASAADSFVWRKQTYFGGLYQKSVARRRPQS
jgi:SAM-dependent methyltransferase